MAIYLLRMNDMRGATEGFADLAVSHDRDALIAWIEGERRCDESGTPATWTDGQWGKTYKAGSPLEWSNPIGPPSIRRPISASHVSVEPNPDGLPYSADDMGHGIIEIIPLDAAMAREFERVEQAGLEAEQAEHAKAEIESSVRFQYDVLDGLAQPNGPVTF